MTMLTRNPLIWLFLLSLALGMKGCGDGDWDWDRAQPSYGRVQR